MADANPTPNPNEDQELEAPFCSKCGQQIKVPPRMPMIRCPACGSHMRFVGGPFLEYVSPLSLDGAVGGAKLDWSKMPH